MKKQYTLRNVPRMVFEHFADLSSLKHGQYSLFQGECFISIVTAKEGADQQNGAFTLSCLDGFHSNGDYKAELCVYDYPAQLEQFKPGYDEYAMDPVLSITFHVEKSGRYYRDKWERGKGYWVEENLIIKSRSDLQLVSRFNSWEFGFFLKLFEYAHMLAKEVLIKGHWQSEWYPQGDYSKRPD